MGFNDIPKDQAPITILKDTIICDYDKQGGWEYTPIKGQICQIFNIPAEVLGIENSNVRFYVGHKIGDGKTSLANLPFEEKDFKIQVETYLKSEAGSDQIKDITEDYLNSAAGADQIKDITEKFLKNTNFILNCN